MPYITRASRLAFECPAHMTPKNAGQLNYAITRILTTYKADEPLNYQKINDIIGALEGAKLEFVRRIVNPYENAKMAENGDVYS